MDETAATEPAAPADLKWVRDESGQVVGLEVAPGLMASVVPIHDRQTVDPDPAADAATE